MGDGCTAIAGTRAAPPSVHGKARNRVHLLRRDVGALKKFWLLHAAWMGVACSGGRVDQDHPLDTVAAQSSAFQNLIDWRRGLEASRDGGAPAPPSGDRPEAARDRLASAKCHARQSCGGTPGCFAEERALLERWRVDECDAVRTDACIARVRDAACDLREGELPAECSARLVCIRE